MYYSVKIRLLVYNNLRISIMIVIDHPASSDSEDKIRSNMKAKANLIKITLTNQQQEQTTIELNRAIFLNGSCCQQLYQASQTQQKAIEFSSPPFLNSLLEEPENQPAFRKFIFYLTLGKLEFPVKDFNLMFMLAVAFQVRSFFHSLILANVNIPFENDATRAVIFDCCFNQFNHVLNDDGEYNFIDWFLNKYSQYNLLGMAVRMFEGDLGCLDTFVVEYLGSKVVGGRFTADDVDEVVGVYVGVGKSNAEAMQRVKRAVPWDKVDVEVISDCKKVLKLTDDEIKLNLQKRLNKLMNVKQDEKDTELEQLKTKKDELRTKFDEIIIKKGAAEIKKNLLQNGVTETAENDLRHSDNKIEFQGIKMNPSKKFTLESEEVWNQDDDDDWDRRRDSVPKISSISQSSEKKLPPMNQSNYSDFRQSQPKPKPSMNKSIQHLEESFGCDTVKSVRLECGCQVCYSCLKLRYIQRLEIYDDLDRLKLDARNFKKYGVRCYLCNGALQEGDAEAFNRLPVD